MNGSSERGPAGTEAIDSPVAEAAQDEAERAGHEEQLDIEREARAFLDDTIHEMKELHTTESSAHVAEVPEPETIAEAIDLPPEAGWPETETERHEQITPEPEPVVAPSETPTPQDVPRPAFPVTAQVGAPVHNESASEGELTEDLVGEVERILQVKRWDKRKNPFRGFDSPPGRF
jgi:hypothetical protein